MRCARLSGARPRSGTSPRSNRRSRPGLAKSYGSSRIPTYFSKVLIDVPLGPGGALRTDRSDLAGVRDRAAGPARLVSVPCSSCARCSDYHAERGRRDARLVRRIGQQAPSNVPAFATAAPAAGRRRGPAAPVAGLARRAGARSRSSSGRSSAGNVDALVELLTADVNLSMPPVPLEYQRPRRRVGRFHATMIRPRQALPTSCRHGPTVSPRSQRTLRAPTGGICHGAGLLVLTLAGDRISAMTRFESNALSWFGLPRSLPEED